MTEATLERPLIVDAPAAWNSDAVRAVLTQIGEGVVERELRDENPFDQVRQVAALGFGTLRLPARLGGQGASIRELFAAVIDVAEADPTVAHIFRAHLLQTEDLIIRSNADDADGAARNATTLALLDAVRAGKIIGNASSERGNSAVGGVDFNTTITTSLDGRRVLNGEKYYTTGTLFADYVAVVASEGDGLTFAVIPTDRNGVEILDDWDGFGQRRTGSGTTRFTDVEIRTEDVLRTIGSDTPPPARDTQAAFAQLYLHAIIAGILRSVVSDATALVQGRARGFSHAETNVPAEDSSLHEVLGELASLAFVAEATVLTAAGILDTAFASTVESTADPELVAAAALAASKTKVVLDEIGTRAATLLFEAGGASSASRARALDRHWRNIRTITLHNPARLKARAIGAQVALGTELPANWYF